jgi:hypothetical protein
LYRSVVFAVYGTVPIQWRRNNPAGRIFGSTWSANVAWLRND